MTTTTDIVQKLWNLCHTLRDDGISYLQYTTELTYLLFLKMAQERDIEAKLPAGYRWTDLVSQDGIDQLNFYRQLLLELGSQSAKPLVQAIYANAQMALKQPRILNKLNNLPCLAEQSQMLQGYSSILKLWIAFKISFKNLLMS
jgi:type I restriction enzyme M protein